MRLGGTHEREQSVRQRTPGYDDVGESIEDRYPTDECVLLTGATRASIFAVGHTSG
jgi:hypothetical protein